MAESNNKSSWTDAVDDLIEKRKTQGPISDEQFEKNRKNLKKNFMKTYGKMGVKMTDEKNTEEERAIDVQTTMFAMRPHESFQGFDLEHRPDSNDFPEGICLLVKLGTCKFPDRIKGMICPDSRELFLSTLYEYEDGWGWIYPDVDTRNAIARYIFYDVKTNNDENIIDKWFWLIIADKKYIPHLDGSGKGEQ